MFDITTATDLLQASDDFPVNFDDLWVWCGYSNKENAKKRLLRNFELDFDFLQMDEPTTTGIQANPKQIIKLTVDAAKEFTMLAQNE